MTSTGGDPILGGPCKGITIFASEKRMVRETKSVPHSRKIITAVQVAAYRLCLDSNQNLNFLPFFHSFFFKKAPPFPHSLWKEISGWVFFMWWNWSPKGLQMTYPRSHSKLTILPLSRLITSLLSPEWLFLLCCCAAIYIKHRPEPNTDMRKVPGI